jgi:hypothetical protein
MLIVPLNGSAIFASSLCPIDKPDASQLDVTLAGAATAKHRGPDQAGRGQPAEHHPSRMSGREIDHALRDWLGHRCIGRLCALLRTAAIAR